jgi:pyruvate/2-oxoglutarate dehydrogenase complex dihydrolipoamide acyltransferase (E2) component
VKASASITRQKNAIHAVTEVDVTEPRRLIREHFEKTGEKLSFTAYIVTCLSQTLMDHPGLNSFIRRGKLVLLDDITVSVLVERDLEGERVPEPYIVRESQKKSYKEISSELRGAQGIRSDKLGSLTGSTWINIIPGFLLRLFVRIADRNIKMAKLYGKLGVTAVGMFGKDALWFIPHGTATVLVTVGSIVDKPVRTENGFTFKEHLCLTVSFDHDIVDGAPATRFMKQFTETVRDGSIIGQ